MEVSRPWRNGSQGRDEADRMEEDAEPVERGEDNVLMLEREGGDKQGGEGYDVASLLYA